ncbi:hypothetical protein [Bacillus thuringiensis]|uniref:hypothetical protein n=1 Tax=Bacillus thuringiensis TaxID=1428 RepID=UPI000BFB91EA|nr:hypothetical protein [Bacillus thuringiensis]PGV73201.1 hypothetical protein COD83_25025 [Bacillus thuringiensis]
MASELNISFLRQGRFSGIQVPSPVLMQPPEVKVEPPLAPEPDRVVFIAGGQERWVIDRSFFHGTPSLKVHLTSDGIRVELTGALFPGTELPADLVCEVHTGGGSTVMNLQFALGQFNCQVSLAEWLAGEQSASVSFELEETTVCHLGSQGQLRIAGDLTMEFFPGWIFRLQGQEIAMVHGLGAPLPCDQIVFGLPAANHESLFASTPDWRTLISLQRGVRNWSLIPEINLPDGWMMVPPYDPYDEIYVETVVDKYGVVEQALVAQAAGDKDDWSLTLGDWSLLLPIRNVCYAMGFDESDVQAVQIGHFSQQPTWYHVGGCSLLLGEGPDALPLELVARERRIERAVIAPALLAFAAPLTGAVVEANRTMPFKVVGIFPGGIAKHPGFSVTEALGLPSLQFDPDFTEPILEMPQDLSFSVLRPDDLLIIRFAFENFILQAGGGKLAHLKRIDQPAYLMAHFSPQHIAEQVFPESQQPQEPPVVSRMSGPSRLVFRVPEMVDEIPYTLKSLLDWSHYEQSVVPAALPPSISPNLLMGHITKLQVDETSPQLEPVPDDDPKAPEKQLKAPEPEHTSIEAPYRLILSPNWFAGWAHVTEPVTRHGVTELWHTRLGVRTEDGVDEQESSLRTVRAIWSPDFNPIVQPEADTSPFLMSLNSDQRDKIVHVSSDFGIKDFVPLPVMVERLMLSSLGAWLNLQGNWPQKANGLVSNWIHRAAMGRDNYVRVVEEGYLFPFGHRAARIDVSERRCEPSPSGEITAYLFKYTYVIVREPERSFPVPGMLDKNDQPSGREFPFRQVRLLTLQTPHLALGSGKRPKPWLMVDDQNDFLFHIVAEDQEGRRIEFTSPLAFVETNQEIQNLPADFTTNPDLEKRRTVHMNGQKVAFAPSSQPGDTAFDTTSLTFGAKAISKPVPSECPLFYPIMQSAEVRLPAAEQVAGLAQPVKIQLHQTFLDSAFEPSQNPGGVFASLINEVGFDFPTEKSGGIVKPDMSIKGLSRTFGPVANDFVTGQFDPKQIFDQAKLLGGILLRNIIDEVKISDFPDSVPQLTNRVIYPKVNGQEDTNSLPEAIETRLRWEPQLTSDPEKIFEKTAETSMKVSALIHTQLQPNAESTYEITGDLRDFNINFIGNETTHFLTLKFSQLTFSAKSGQKPTITPRIEDVEFAGALQFVNELRDLLKSIGKEPGLDVTPKGITVSNSLAIPTLAVGILAIQNLALSSKLEIPFDGTNASIHFAFASRENPFMLTVAIFGGGGFFVIILDLDPQNPVRLLEASLEFGGNLALDIGVASGGVHLMAGIYFKMENGNCQLTGYVRCGGSLEVLGLITISAEFYLSLNYRDPGKAWGQATLTVKVEVLMFSQSVDLTVEKQFAGSAGDPPIAEMIDQDDWAVYCEAFA